MNHPRHPPPRRRGIPELELLESRKLLAAVAFSSPITTSLTTSQYSTSAVVTADVNNDGIPDLIVGHDNGSGQVFLGTKTGAFTPGALVGPGAQLLAANTFNGSTNIGLATAVAVLPGNGNGTFSTATAANNYVLPRNTVALYGADVNGDGIEDLIAATLTPAAQSSEPATLGFSVLLGSSTGAFKAPISMTVGSAMGLGPIYGANFQFDDFNGDGIMDALTPFGVMLGKGDGTFAAPLPFPQAPGTSSGTGSGPGSGAGTGSSGSGSTTGSPATLLPIGSAIAVDDFNNDGKLDVAFLPPSGQPAGQVDIILGKGDGTFINGTPISLGSGVTITALSSGDLNADGNSDLIVGTSAASSTTASTGGLDVFAGNGDGTFGAPTALATPPGQPFQISTGDFNADGNLDILAVTEPPGTVSGTANNQVIIPAANASVYLNTKPVPLTPTVTLAVSAPRVVAGGTLTFSAIISPPSAPPVRPGTIPTSAQDPVPTGTVTFMDGSAKLGTAAVVNGRAKLATTLGGVGTQSITAVYSGDVSYAGVTSAARNVIVLLSASAAPLLVPTLTTATVPSLFLPKDSGSVTITLTNGGAGAAVGRVSVDLFLSTSRTLDASAIPITAPALQNRPISVGVGATTTITGNFTLGTYAAGAYYLIAQIIPVARLTTDQFTTTTLLSPARYQAAGLVFGTVGTHTALTLPVTDAGGDKAILSIAGNGTGTVTENAGGLDDISLTGTNQSSRLLITPVRGTFTFDAITVNGALATLTGNRAIVTGKLQITGSISTITLAGAGQGGTMPMTLGSGANATLSLGTVSGVNLNSSAPIGTLTASSWVGGQLIAPSIQTLSVRGTFDPDVIVHGTGTIGTATLGAVDAGTWAVGGGIGTLRINASLSDASIYAGADAGADNVLGTSDDRYTVASISSLLVGGAVTASTIAAGAAPASGGTIQQGIVLLPKGAIRAITVRGAVSDDSRFLAAILPTRVSLGGTFVIPATDPRFQV